MKISTEISSASLLVGEEKAVELIAKAGFDAWDFSMYDSLIVDWTTLSVSPSDHPFCGDNYLAFAGKLRKIGEDNGIHCNQSHAPIPTGDNIMEYLKRAVECTAEAGGKICVVHPDCEKNVQENAELYIKLLEFAKPYGVKIAAENLYKWDRQLRKNVFAPCATPESFVEHLRAVNHPDLVACLDVGHAEMGIEDTSAEKMVHALGPKLQALHMHDTDLVNDNHQIPFSMKIDFEKIVKALKEIGYNGYFTLEANNYLSDFNKDTVFQGIKDLADAAHKLSDMFEKA